MPVPESDLKMGDGHINGPEVSGSGLDLEMPELSKPYKFTAANPPLLTQVKGDVFSIPDENLQEEIGRTQWDKHTTTPTAAKPDGTAQFINTDIKTTITRVRRWALADAPFRVAAEREIELKRVVGWSVTDKVSMEKTLNVEAGGDLFGFTVSAKAGLKLTEDLTKEWKEETTTTVKYKLASNTTYCNWVLYDQMYAKVETKISTDNIDRPATGEATVTQASFRVTLSYFEDSALDPHAAILVSSITSFQRASGPLLVGAPRQV